MVFGDGDQGENCLSLARSADITAHELGHAITENESGLVYSGEAGGINESTSDIFGAFVEAWADGGGTGTLAPSTNTWLFGEDVLAPWLRTMCDPTEDGASRDIWTTTLGILDVHYSSGVGNLAFCLLVNGGSHPRNQTSTIVTAIGMDKAIRIFYKAEVDILVPTSTFASWRTATEQAAVQLGYDAATRKSVTCAWEAVKVGAVSGTRPTLAVLPSITPLYDGVALGAQSGGLGVEAFYTYDVAAGATSFTVSVTGGTGNSDLYVQYAGRPSLSSYLCRSVVAGNTATCTVTAPPSGRYWLMLHGTAAYAGVSITATSAFADPFLSSGVGVSLSSTGGTYQYWRVSPGTDSTLKVKLSGSSGDADLYVRALARPTEYVYDCRSNGATINELCTIMFAGKGTYEVMVRTRTAFRLATLTATWSPAL